jgi:hypothetical protein
MTHGLLYLPRTGVSLAVSPDASSERVMAGLGPLRAGTCGGYRKADRARSFNGQRATVGRQSARLGSGPERFSSGRNGSGLRYVGRVPLPHQNQLF